MKQSQFSWVSPMCTGNIKDINLCFFFSPVNLSFIMGAREASQPRTNKIIRKNIVINTGQQYKSMHE